MHQDQRIGLALGVLLVGACAAFFFRNEARTAAPIPKLQHAQELDDRIAERPTRPYLKGIEAVEASDRRRSRSQDQESSDCDHSSSEWTPFDPPGTQVSSENVSRNRNSRSKPSGDDGEIQELAPIAIPNDVCVSGDESTGNNTQTSTRHTSPKTTTSESRVHVVQKGETLSSIAAKTLGSPNRFHEIFEANQDQLRDPNDLKLGMTLRIPRHGSVSKSDSGNGYQPLDQTSVNMESETRDSMIEEVLPSVELRAPSNSTRPESLDSPSLLIPPALPSDSQIDSPGDSPDTTEESPSNGTKKFVPSRRTIPPTRPVGPQAKVNSPRDTGGRKLTQVSLESTSGKVAR